MISFAIERGKAILFNDVGSENGWIFKYDSVNKKFLVWDNVEREKQGGQIIIEIIQ
jgi:uncharacterized protein YwqG